MRVYRPQFTDKSGQRRLSSVYRVVARMDNRDISASVSTVKSIAREFGVMLQRLCDQVSAGQQPDDRLYEWLDGLSEKLRRRLQHCGVMEKIEEWARLPLVQHIERWAETFPTRVGAWGLVRRTRHANEKRARLRKSCSGCGFYCWREVAEDHRQALETGESILWKWFADLDCSDATRDNYRAAWHSFGLWMGSRYRSARSPVAELRAPKAYASRRIFAAMSD